MRILINSRFYPSVGGIETVTAQLAHEFYSAGMTVTVLTDVPAPTAKTKQFPFSVFYQPTHQVLWELTRAADIFVQMNISLKTLWPAFLTAIPFVAVHHTFYIIDRTGNRDWRERFKLRTAQRAHNIFASQAISTRLGFAGEVIPNPYDNQLFNCRAGSHRDRDLVFVGRLVSDKGADLLIRALGIMATQGLHPTLTIIGDGPERSALENLSEKSNLKPQLIFTGSLEQPQVADLLRLHQILVVPSLWEEPFGVVALEGAACGCVVLGSDGGGLPEAIGPAGLTFKRGDMEGLVLKLTYLIQNPAEWASYRLAAEAHLAKHDPTSVAERYLRVFQAAIDGF